MKMSTEAWIAVLSIIPSLIQAVEQLFGSGTGTTKKQVVTEMAHSALNALEAASTGGQKTTIKKLAPVISPIIDSAVDAIYNQQPSG